MKLRFDSETFGHANASWTEHTYMGSVEVTKGVCEIDRSNPHWDVMLAVLLRKGFVLVADEPVETTAPDAEPAATVDEPPAPRRGRRSTAD